MVRYVCCVYTGLPRFSDENLAMSRTLRVLTKFCFAKLVALCPQRRAMFRNAWNVNRKMNKCPKAPSVVFEAAPEIEHRRRRRPRERRLKAGKMLRWSILSESPSSCAAKACVAWEDGAKAEGRI